MIKGQSQEDITFVNDMLEEETAIHSVFACLKSMAREPGGAGSRHGS